MIWRFLGRCVGVVRGFCGMWYLPQVELWAGAGLIVGLGWYLVRCCFS